MLRGAGNNGEDQQEGLRYRNVIGTYLHGPILPANPKVADFLITKALERRGIRRTWRRCPSTRLPRRPTALPRTARAETPGTG